MANRINPNDAKTLIEQGAAVADIRDALSFQSEHIRGAQRLDNNNLNEFMQKTAKDKPIVVCCYHGNSSQGAAQFLDSQGFEQVYSLNGGFEQWKLLYPDWVAH